jgi:hypothetical protein
MRQLLASSLIACVLLATPAARADGVLPDVATPVQREQAQSRFVRGRDLLSRKQYDDALVEFRASHDIVASPNTRLEIARCLRTSGKLVAAYAELGRTSIEAKELLAQDNRYQRAYDAAIAERKEIEPQLGFVTLTVQNATDDTTVTVDGEEIKRAAWNEPIPVTPASSQVVVSTAGHAPVKTAVNVAAGQRQALTIDALSGDAGATPATAPTESAPADGTSAGPSLRTWAYVAGGVGVAGLATFGIFAVLAKGTYDDLNGACHGGPCPPDKSGEISSGKTQQTVANVGLAVGLVGAAAGVTLYVLSMPKSSASTTAASTALVVGPGWAGLQGRF